MSEKDLVAKAQDAVGTSDTILAAATFEPRGTSGGFVAGGTVGGTIGQAIGGDLGNAIGNVAGTALGMEAGKHAGGFSSDEEGALHQVPWASLVAVSDTRIYGWRLRLEGLHTGLTDQLFTLDRTDIAVTVHSRVTVHTVEVADLRTHERWEFESARFSGHLKSLLAELHDTRAATAS